jgi:hypothetical protein
LQNACRVTERRQRSSRNILVTNVAKATGWAQRQQHSHGERETPYILRDNNHQRLYEDSVWERRGSSLQERENTPGSVQAETERTKVAMWKMGTQQAESHSQRTGRMPKEFMPPGERRRTENGQAE